jgi:hypothetical protein
VAYVQALDVFQGDLEEENKEEEDHELVLAQQEVADLIKLPHTLTTLVLSYNTINRMHFVKGAWRQKSIMEKLLSRLEGLKARKVPYLFPPRGFDCEKGKSCFDLFVRERQTNLAKRFLGLMIASDPRG